MQKRYGFAYVLVSLYFSVLQWLRVLVSEPLRRGRLNTGASKLLHKKNIRKRGRKVGGQAAIAREQRAGEAKQAAKRAAKWAKKPAQNQ